MSWVTINGIEYDVLVLDVEENFNILYSENTQRTLDKGSMFLDPIGAFKGHKVTFGRRNDNVQAFDAIWDYLSTPRTSGTPVSIVDGQSVLSYDAYVSNGVRKLTRIDTATGTVYWDAFEANFIPMEAQVLP